MKIAIGIIVIVIAAVAAFYIWGPGTTPSDMTGTQGGETMEVAEGDREVVRDGTYRVVPEESEIRWAGQKPLIDGYVNSGSIAVESGTITVAGEEATGEFTIDMNTISVSETPTKPGQENTLEGHLKGERWFNVAEYPTATFTILEVTPRADSETSHMYDIRGELTMKGETGELSFPATIYSDADGRVHASAEFEFDRTEWGLTSGSGSFFDDLADNVIADEVAMSFHLVAEQE